MIPDPHELTACAARALIAEGRLTAEALVQACLDRIAEREPVVGAWETLDPAAALAQARRLDRDGPGQGGLLHGLPVGVKDLFDTQDFPTAYGSPVYADHQPAADAACVAAARAAGAVVLGKTVTTEFAAFHPGKTVNPRHPGHTPGGSSSGSAAAVADRMVPLALGTQTAGSVIRPAAFCGVVGYKPSAGWIARAGVKPLAASLDAVGVFARDVPDAALFAAALSGRPGLLLPAVTGEMAPPRVGFWNDEDWPQPATVAAAVLARAAADLARVGVVVREVTLPAPLGELTAAQAEIMAFEAARELAFEHLHHAPRLSPALRDLLATGQRCPPERYDAAQELAARGRHLFAPWLAAENLDLLVVPSAVGEAPAGLGATGDPVFNRLWTLLGGPCVHLPVGLGPGGLPVGLQLVGPFGADARTLRWAEWIDQRLRPPLPLPPD